MSTTRSRQYRNPRYAPEGLERRLSPSGFGAIMPPAHISTHFHGAAGAAVQPKTGVQPKAADILASTTTTTTTTTTDDDSDPTTPLAPTTTDGDGTGTPTMPTDPEPGTVPPEIPINPPTGPDLPA